MNTYFSPEAGQVTTSIPPSNVTEEQEATQNSGELKPENFGIPFLVVVCVVSFVGNLFVLLVYSQRRYRKSNAGLYILNLALGDMLAVVVVLFHITEFFEVTWPILWRTDLQCKLHRYFRFVAFDLTVFSMVAIAIDRYFAVVHPLRFRLTFNAIRTKVICGVIWGLALLAALPTPLMFETYFNSDVSEMVVTYKGKLPFACKVITPFGPWWPGFKSIYLNVVLCYVPTLLTAVLYIVIIVHIRRKSRPLRVTGLKVSDRKSWKSARILLVVFVAYVVCYGSFATYNVVSKYVQTAGNVAAVIYNVCLLLPYANSCMNPIIYSYVNPTFRKACRELLCGRRRERTLGKDSVTVSRDNMLDTMVVLKMTTNGNC